MLIKGEKYACDACVRGHRVSSCQHQGESTLTSTDTTVSATCERLSSLQHRGVEADHFSYQADAFTELSAPELVKLTVSLLQTVL